jgi:hypothetical protein
VDVAVHERAGVGLDEARDDDGLVGQAVGVSRTMDPVTEAGPSSRREG